MKVNLIMYFTKRLMRAVGTDIMGNEKFDSPQKPCGDEDYLWSPDSKKSFT
jgi:hypothetical protein